MDAEDSELGRTSSIDVECLIFVQSEVIKVDKKSSAVSETLR
jgi:hypothetical protein